MVVGGALYSGFLICKACRKDFGCSSAMSTIFVTDLPEKAFTQNGMYISSEKSSIVEGDGFRQGWLYVWTEEEV